MAHSPTLQPSGLWNNRSTQAQVRVYRELVLWDLRMFPSDSLLISVVLIRTSFRKVGGGESLLFDMTK